MWRGVTPTAQRAALVAGVQLPVYDFSKQFFIANNLLTDGATNHLFSSFLAGLCACTASSPVDVIRTRMMIQRNFKDSVAKRDINKAKLLFGCSTAEKVTRKRQSHAAASQEYRSRIYTSSIQCALVTVRSEGVQALYKGFVPAFLRMGPWNIIFFLVYEQLKKLNKEA